MIISCTARDGKCIRAEAIMLSKYGEVYQCIDGLYHPNPGEFSESDGYEELERCVDWLCCNYGKLCSDLHSYVVDNVFLSIEQWIMYRVREILYGAPDTPLSELIKEVMYSDTYLPCSRCRKMISDCVRQPFAVSHSEYLEASRNIANFINQSFIRVRAGGKLNPNGSDAIYFRISSRGYDWKAVIYDFLWNTFGTTAAMPAKIWIGNDAETKPPETTLFEGTPAELFNSDTKIYSAKSFK